MAERMSKNQVVCIANQLLRDNNLHLWTVTFDRAMNRAGQCRYGSKTLSFSEPLLKARTYEGTLDTIRHEVAHAIVGVEYRNGRSYGHTPAWKREYKRLGGDGNRCFSDETIINPIKQPYEGTCPGCNRKVYMQRKPRRVRSCATCNPVVFDTRFAFHWRHNGRLIDIESA